MTKYKKLLIVVSILFIIAIVIFLWLPPSQERMEKYFLRDKAELNVVCEYLSTVDCDATIEYDRTDYYLIKYELVQSTNKLDLVKLKIEDEVVVDAVKKLFIKRGYHKIYKNENTVVFAKWHRGPDLSGGVAYRINESAEIEIGYVTKLSPLMDENWYYYEVNYNEWRSNNFENFI